MILLLDTSTPTCKLTVVDSDSHYDYEWEAGRSLAKGLLAFLRDKLSEHDAAIHDIRGIGVMKGPGSFTGLRIGLTVMNTLADSLSVAVVGETGKDWQATALDRLRRGDNDQIVLPHYGAGPNITQPRK